MHPVYWLNPDISTWGGRGHFYFVLTLGPRFPGRRRLLPDPDVSLRSLIYEADKRLNPRSGVRHPLLRSTGP